MIKFRLQKELDKFAQMRGISSIPIREYEKLSKLVEMEISFYDRLRIYSEMYMHFSGKDRCYDYMCSYLFWVSLSENNFKNIKLREMVRYREYLNIIICSHFSEFWENAPTLIFKNKFTNSENVDYRIKYLEKIIDGMLMKIEEEK